LQFFWPISVNSADLPMLPVALGALLGLYLLIRGCILLQRKPGNSSGKTVSLTPLVDVTRSAPEVPAGSKQQVIRLTPDGESDVSTQQGRIAAALLKAGISSPTSWSGAGEKSPAALAEEQSAVTYQPGGLVESLNLTTARALEKAGSATLTHALSDTFQPFRWKPALMIWGGPILTLACIYLLAAHFGWL
jgi:hypothetical protein